MTKKSELIVSVIHPSHKKYSKIHHLFEARRSAKDHSNETLLVVLALSVWNGSPKGNMWSAIPVALLCMVVS